MAEKYKVLMLSYFSIGGVTKVFFCGLLIVKLSPMSKIKGGTQRVAARTRS